MSRSGYSDDCDGWELIMYRGAVASATRGKRGQQLLRDLLMALDAMPNKRLIAHELEHDGEVCALGALGKVRGMCLEVLNPEESEDVAAAFHVAPALVKEIVFENDEDFHYSKETPEARWSRMRAWVVSQIIPQKVAT